ncbi:MAG TPA: ABC transporter ATP-binding protein [Acidimicrobiia bacterium]|nr:ABC transporter ATP-binding protein [Acidimicrobiia bacterium]
MTTATVNPPEPARAERLGRTAVSIRNVSKTYGDGHSALLALDDISLDVGAGEFVCTVGASGCGKTTLLNLIAGIYHVQKGTIDVGGRRVSLMFQESALFPWLTVERNVELALQLRKVPKAERRAKVAELLRLVRLDGFAENRPHELSGGMQQRVAIARALAQEAEVMLMDEPFGALDAMTRDVMHDELERIWTSTGLSVLFVTHNVREAVRLGDRVVVLTSRPGRVAEEIAIDLPRPRRIDDRGVSELAGMITDRLKAEVRRHADDTGEDQRG